ncbi:MAG: hypothetical protein ACKVX9_21215 [Blastocatellia bacterium]
MTDQSSGRYGEHIWIVALYEEEPLVNELLDRLSAIGVDTSEATTVRVEINDQIRAATFTPMETPLSITTRSAVSGALIGGAFALFVGMGLYAMNLLALPFLSGLFHHAVASVASGGMAGGAIGALLGFARQRQSMHLPLRQMQEVKSDGYLVTVRMPPSLAEQAEEIARGLGAKQILL